MEKGMLVTWTTKTGAKGNGRVLTNTEDGHVMVAVDSDGELHPVIYCAVTWLKEVPKKV
jgi:hypothetical protein